MLIRHGVYGALLAGAFMASPAAAAFEDETLLIRQPSVAEGTVAFAYAGDLWIGSLQGGDARRLTVHPGVESDPFLSPDGRFVAFTGRYDGSPDVYVVPTAGGDPVRLVWIVPDTRWPCIDRMCH
jgi:Protease, putative